MSIHQLSVSHDERQDRLLWRLNTVQGEEFQFWLTRRMLTRLLPALNQALLKLHASAPELAASDTVSLQMLREFKRDKLLAHADFKTPFVASAQSRPMGQEPLLVTDAHLSLHAQTGLGLVLEEKSGQSVKSCQLNLSTELVEGLLVLTQQALQSADWSFTASPTSEHTQALGHDGLPTLAPPHYKH